MIPTFPKLNALIVEDNPVCRALFTSILENHELKVISCESGTKAIDCIKKYNNFDFVFMDIHMPEIDGYETTKKIREIESTENLKRNIIIALTAKDMEGDKEKCLGAGMDYYISKPVTQEDILEIIKKFQI